MIGGVACLLLLLQVKKGLKMTLHQYPKCELHDWTAIFLLQQSPYLTHPCLTKSYNFSVSIILPLGSHLHEPHPLLQMRWLQSLLSPLKKLWFRLHSTPKKSRGIYILYEDVKSCPYEDVQVLWSILVESHTPSMPSKQ
ncbi:uncharacterized protein LOC126669193 [Mercurialis annua]|uniref:uncharacterized protein LOC126669193 n=1 Tax=Mercurialis annua TaxID=3986 RepID=UPI0021605B95|nr:uncharacterized protein LOC126669193 [Mercurialis annua]